MTLWYNHNMHSLLRNIKYNPLKTERNAHQRLAFLLVSKGLINDFLYLSTPCKYGIIYKLLKLLEFTTSARATYIYIDIKIDIKKED